MSPLRIEIYGLNYAPEPTGIAPYTTGLARFLAEAGHEVRVVTGYPHYPYWRIADGYSGLRHRERDGDVEITRVRHPVPANPTGRSRITAEATFALHAGLQRGPRPDVVLAVSPALLSVATAAARCRTSGRPALGVVVQDLYSRAIAETGALGGRGARAAAALERTLLSRADGVVAIHDMFRESMIDLGITPSKVSVIRNWTHNGPSIGDRAATRERLGWTDDAAVLLHAGNMGAKQGLENVVAAARLADQRKLPIRFVLLGAGNQRAALEASASGVERLQFVDPVPDADFATTLAAADVLLLNERPEVAEMCVPSKLTSYFAAGRPVLAATSERSAGAHEIADSGAGLRVVPGDPAALVDGARRLLADAEAAADMGRRGRAYAESLLAEQTAREAYLSWVDELAGGRAAGPSRPAERVGRTTAH